MENTEEILNDFYISIYRLTIIKIYRFLNDRLTILYKFLNDRLIFDNK